MSKNKLNQIQSTSCQQHKCYEGAKSDVTEQLMSFVDVASTTICSQCDVTHLARLLETEIKHFSCQVLMYVCVSACFCVCLLRQQSEVETAAAVPKLRTLVSFRRMCLSRCLLVQ